MAGPTGRVTALTSTTFTVTVDSLSGTASTTLRLRTRARSTTGAWTDAATDATPAVGDTLQATGLTAGTSLEWWLVETTSGGTTEDGTRGQVTPATSIWDTLMDAIETALSGCTVYRGAAPLETYPETTAVLRMLPEEVVESANNLYLTAYPIEVEYRLRDFNSAGTQHYDLTAQWQAVLYDAFSGATAADYPSITGLHIVTVDPQTNDEPGEYESEARAVSVVRFQVWE